MSLQPSPAITRAVHLLARALQQDLLLGRKLLDVTEHQAQALRNHEPERVQELLVAGEVVAAQQQEAGRQRVEAIQGLALALGMKPDAGSALPPLSDLALHLPLPDARRLLALRSEILAVEERLREAAERNRALIQNALEFVQFSLQALTGAALKPSRYGVNPNAVVAPTFYLDHKA
jgi:flagellar biosynthesis/type III secretory pathway chaperone